MSKSKSLVILPTYMEKKTLPVVLANVLSQEAADILVIDDNSPDGTGRIAESWAGRDPRVHVMNRPGKMGLGTAYVAGFLWGLERDYDCFIEMDSDMSHNPLDLPRFIAEIDKGADLVIGSRYIGGKISVVGWDFKRLLLSKFANFYASRILGSRLSDLTSGYRAFSRRALEQVAFDEVHSGGYAFQIEMAYNLCMAGMRVEEIPIVFTERASGSSKMSKAIIREAVWLPWRLRLRRINSSFIRRALGMKKKHEKTEQGG
ncbi:MAG: polyprenol monophosphomannose synthase [Nitrospiraceae bacterium]|nr:polyprenol monophosphomannose synthase [Nitrospiraceae bacterium]